LYDGNVHNHISDGTSHNICLAEKHSDCYNIPFVLLDYRRSVSISGVPYDIHCKAVLFLASCGFEGKMALKNLMPHTYIIDWFYFFEKSSIKNVFKGFVIFLLQFFWFI
jgi:hypothetical protein